IVDEHVDAAEALARRGRDGSRRCRLADVSGDRDDTPLLSEAPPRPLELLPVAPVDDHARALGQEAPRQVEADAAARTGDDDSINSVGHECVSFLLTEVPGISRTRKSYVAMDSIT